MSDDTDDTPKSLADVPASTRTVVPASTSACDACPWRLSNQGKPHPDGWYTQKNLMRLWAKLRRGDAMTCHPTDPTNPISDKALEKGVQPAKATAPTRECAGALTLQQREVAIFQGVKDLKTYIKLRPRGMTRHGLIAIVERVIFGGTSLGGDAMPACDLNDEAIGAEWLPAFDQDPRNKS